MFMAGIQSVASRRQIALLLIVTMIFPMLADVLDLEALLNRMQELNLIEPVSMPESR
tara:strand:- start:569 stop:739 length:171 start_codon:yes stop_codon:yes gene_type:complete